MKIIILLSMMLLVSNNAFSQGSAHISSHTNELNPDNNLHFVPFFGFSPYGGFGIEFNKANHSAGIGFPYRLFYRYYKTPYTNSWFFGMYAGRYELDLDDGKIIDGTTYTDKVTTDAGLGFSYIWHWSSGWNVAANVSATYRPDSSAFVRCVTL